MNLDHTPHPDIEDHYHIRELIEGQEKRSADRTYHKNRAKDLAERDDLIADAKWVETKDFWCDICKLDFKGQAVKQVEEDWSTPQRIAFYKTKCFKGHWCIRLITDRHKDAFYQKSKFVALDRGNHHEDTMQPFETGFNLLYGK